MRCFVSVDIEDPEILNSLESIQGRLERTGADLKLVERENLHFTLRFLGETREGLVSELKKLVSSNTFSPFKVEFKGVGVFPHMRRPRVVWVGISRGVEELTEIFQSLEPGIVGMGFNPEIRPFKPHLTIARVRSGRNRDKLLYEVSSHRDDIVGEMTVESIRLKKSVLTPRGPIYSTLAQTGT